MMVSSGRDFPMYDEIVAWLEESLMIPTALR